MKHVSFFPLIIITNKYFSSSLLSKMNVKFLFWTIVEIVDNKGWMNGFNYVKFKFE